MSHGNLGAWQKAVGDEIGPGDVLCEIETDKATVDFENQDDGFLARILVPSGTSELEVGTLLGLIVENEEDIAAVKNWSPSESAAAEPSADPQPAIEIPVASTSSSSAAARQPSITFRYGKRDGPVAAAPSAPASLPTPINATIATPAAATAAPVPAAPAPAATASSSPGDAARGYTDIKVSAVRKVIASRLTESKATVPHTYASAVCGLEGVAALRASLAAAGLRISVNDVVIKAAALALRDVPQVNSSYDPVDGSVRASPSVDVSVAVATDGGLITPIVTAADGRGLAGINGEVKALAARARAGKLSPSEYQGGSFTISNLGMFGINRFTAVINPPQSAILAVGTSSTRMVESTSTEEGAPALTPVTQMTVTLSADRRVVDGATSAEFLAAFTRYVENPTLLSA